MSKQLFIPIIFISTLPLHRTFLKILCSSSLFVEYYDSYAVPVVHLERWTRGKCDNANFIN